jgi:hypothetical protein
MLMLTDADFGREKKKLIWASLISVHNLFRSVSRLLAIRKFCHDALNPDA